VTGPERPDPLAEPEGYGQRPGPAGGVIRDGRCTMGAGEGRCPLPKVMTLWYGGEGCEHVGPMDYCDAHGRAVLNAFSHVCGECQEAGRRMPVRLLKAEGAVPDYAQAALDRLELG
jgi:hypothetical protein